MKGQELMELIENNFTVLKLLKTKIEKLELKLPPDNLKDHKGDKVENINDNPKSWIAWKNKAEEEKEARIKYQFIVYNICLLFDTRSVKTTIDVVVDKVKALLPKPEKPKNQEECECSCKDWIRIKGVQTCVACHLPLLKPQPNFQCAVPEELPLTKSFTDEGMYNKQLKLVVVINLLSACVKELQQKWEER